MPHRILRPERIRMFRRRHGLNQEQLAGRAGCARNTIYRAEAGQCSPKLAGQIADALGFDVDELYEVVGDSHPLTSEEREFLAVFRALDEEYRKALWYFMLGLQAKRYGQHGDNKGHNPSCGG